MLNCRLIWSYTVSKYIYAVWSGATLSAGTSVQSDLELHCQQAHPCSLIWSYTVSKHTRAVWTWSCTVHQSVNVTLFYKLSDSVALRLDCLHVQTDQLLLCPHMAYTLGIYGLLKRISFFLHHSNITENITDFASQNWTKMILSPMMFLEGT